MSTAPIPPPRVPLKQRMKNAWNNHKGKIIIGTLITAGAVYGAYQINQRFNSDPEPGKSKITFNWEDQQFKRTGDFYDIYMADPATGKIEKASDKWNVEQSQAPGVYSFDMDDHPAFDETFQGAKSVTLVSEGAEKFHRVEYEVKPGQTTEIKANFKPTPERVKLAQSTGFTPDYEWITSDNNPAVTPQEQATPLLIQGHAFKEYADITKGFKHTVNVEPGTYTARFLDKKNFTEAATLNGNPLPVKPDGEWIYTTFNVEDGKIAEFKIVYDDIPAAGAGQPGTGTAGTGAAGTGTAGTGTAAAGTGTAGAIGAGTSTAGAGAGTGTAGTGTAGTGTAGTGAAPQYQSERFKFRADCDSLASCVVRPGILKIMEGDKVVRSVNLSADGTNEYIKLKATQQLRLEQLADTNTRGFFTLNNADGGILGTYFANNNVKLGERATYTIDGQQLQNLMGKEKTQANFVINYVKKSGDEACASYAKVISVRFDDAAQAEGYTHKTSSAVTPCVDKSTKSTSNNTAQNTAQNTTQSTVQSTADQRAAAAPVQTQQQTQQVNVSNNDLASNAMWQHRRPVHIVNSFYASGSAEGLKNIFSTQSYTQGIWNMGPYNGTSGVNQGLLNSRVKDMSFDLHMYNGTASGSTIITPRTQAPAKFEIPSNLRSIGGVGTYVQK